MKSNVCRSATLGLVGSALVGSLFIGNTPAHALPDEQVVQKLRSVPVFTITDAQGAPLVAQVNNQQNKPASVAGVFISQRDAQSFIERLKKENPNLGKTVQVVPVSLGEVYKLGQAQQNKPQSLNFAFVPMQQQVQTAQAVMRQNGQQAQQFNGVPLFVARAGKEQGYLTIQQNNKPVIPLFFDKEQLQEMIDRFKKQKPDLASSVKIQVLNLEGVIESLRTKNDQNLNQIVLFPSRESIAFLQKLPAAGANQPQSPQRNAAPANQPQRPRR